MRLRRQRTQVFANRSKRNLDKIGMAIVDPVRNSRDFRAGVMRAHLRPVMQLLSQAYYYAADTDEDVWTFAVEIASLRLAQANDNDLRWLVAQGYIEHAVETTKDNDARRSFQSSRALLFRPTSCFVCTPAGAAFSEGILFARDEVNGSATKCQSPSPLIPKWDKDRRQLQCAGRLIKEFKVPAPNQESILAVFEEEGWPPRIDDPLPPFGDIDPRRRLHDAIKALNRNQKSEMLRFMGDGRGEGVCWEFRRSPDSHL